MSRTHRNRDHWEAWGYLPSWPKGDYRYHRDWCCQQPCCSPKARRRLEKAGGKWMKWGERKMMERGTGE